MNEKKKTHLFRSQNQRTGFDYLLEEAAYRIIRQREKSFAQISKQKQKKFKNFNWTYTTLCLLWHSVQISSSRNVKVFFSLSVQLLLTTTNKFISIYCTVFAKKKRRKIFEIQSWNGKLHLQKFTQQLVSVNHCDCLQRTKKKNTKHKKDWNRLSSEGEHAKRENNFFFFFFFLSFILILSTVYLWDAYPEYIHCIFFFSDLSVVSMHSASNVFEIPCEFVREEKGQWRTICTDTNPIWLK